MVAPISGNNPDIRQQSILRTPSPTPSALGGVGLRNIDQRLESIRLSPNASGSEPSTASSSGKPKSPLITDIDNSSAGPAAEGSISSPTSAVPISPHRSGLTAGLKASAGLSAQPLQPAAGHVKTGSVHAHFLIDDVVGHSGGTRSRSSSGSGTAIGQNDINPSKISHLIHHPVDSYDGKNRAGLELENSLEPRDFSTTREQKLMDTLSGGSISGPSSSASAGITTATGASNNNIPFVPVVPSSTPDTVSSTTTGAVPPPTTTNPLPSSSNGPTAATNLDIRLPQDDGKLHVLLGATGSISTGKLRLIINKLEDIFGKNKISVQLILTKAAENFVSRGEIPSNVCIWRDKDEWANWRSRTDPVVHIELRRWADIFVIAPLSANTLGKIALGLCDNLLTNVVRAWNTQYPILIAPAMTSYAYNHPATRRHLKVIKEEMKWIDVLKPVEKVVGSYGDIGMGGMMDWNEIVNRTVLKLGGYPEDQDEEEEDESRDLGDDDDDDDDDLEDEQDNDGSKSKTKHKSKSGDGEDDDDDEDDDEDDEESKERLQLSLAQQDQLNQDKHKLRGSNSFA